MAGINRPILTFNLVAPHTACPKCGGSLWVSQHCKRTVETLDATVQLNRRDKRCPHCNDRERYRPIVDPRLALPNRQHGLDVALHIGVQHFDRGRSLRNIGAELLERKVPIHQTTLGEQLRDFMALSRAAIGDEPAVRERLRAQGGIVLLCDGVFFDSGSPLYLAFDALSQTLLFGERKPQRGADDFEPLLLRVKAMDVPVIAIVSDKESGFLPAVARVFPNEPHQLCHSHFLTNAAKPMAADLAGVVTSVERRRGKLKDVLDDVRAERKAELKAQAAQPTATPTPNAPAAKAAKAAKKGRSEASAALLTEAELVLELGHAAQRSSRSSGRAPLNPVELAREDGLEAVRQATLKAIRIKGATARSSVNWQTP